MKKEVFAIFLAFIFGISFVLATSPGVELNVDVGDDGSWQYDVWGQQINVYAGEPVRFDAETDVELGYPVFSFLGRNNDVTHLWTFADGTASHPLVHFSKTPVASFPPGYRNVTVKVFTSNGEVADTNVLIYAMENDAPSVDVLINGDLWDTSDPSLIYLTNQGETLELGRIASDSDGLGYDVFKNGVDVEQVWDFDGAVTSAPFSSFIKNPQVTLTEERIYNMKLKVYDSRGSMTQKEFSINAKANSILPSGGVATTSPSTCSDGDSRPCGTDIGECLIGTQTCSGGVWGNCVGSIGPSVEICDALDNDCNGLIDDGLDGSGCNGQVDTTPPRELSSGPIVTNVDATSQLARLTISWGESIDQPSGLPVNDYSYSWGSSSLQGDGITSDNPILLAFPYDDSGYICIAGVDPSGNEGNQWCTSLGPYTSESTGPVCGDGIREVGETCDDGNTNNGDGCSSTCQVEISCIDGDFDGFSPFGGPCGPVDCNDADSTIFPGAADSTCNGIDNDCNGFIDDSYISVVTNCGLGVCSGNTGATICQSGIVIDTCDPFAGAVAETCSEESGYDGLDNNCDGLVDLNCDSTCDPDGDGYAAPIYCLFGGYPLGDCQPNDAGINPSAPEICGDGIDNDCDAVTMDVCELPSCTIDFAYWSLTEVNEGEEVTLNTEITDCNGELFNFTIYERDALSDDQIDTFVSTTPNPVWNAIHEDDGLGDSEYYFRVYPLSDYEQVIPSLNPDLIVRESSPTIVCGDDVVGGAEICDGTNLIGETCVSQGFIGGTLSCASNCLSYDTSSCSGDSLPPGMPGSISLNVDTTTSPLNAIVDLSWAKAIDQPTGIRVDDYRYSYGSSGGIGGSGDLSINSLTLELPYNINDGFFCVAGVDLTGNQGPTRCRTLSTGSYSGIEEPPVENTPPQLSLKVDLDGDGVGETVVQEGDSISVESGTQVKFDASATDPNGLGYPVFAFIGKNAHVSYLWNFGGGKPQYPLSVFTDKPRVTYSVEENQDSFPAAVRAYDSLGAYEKVSFTVDLTPPTCDWFEESLAIGESYNSYGKTLTLDSVLPDRATFNGIEILYEETGVVDGIYVHLESIGYHTNSPELSKVIVFIDKKAECLSEGATISRWGMREGDKTHAFGRVFTLEEISENSIKVEGEVINQGTSAFINGIYVTPGFIGWFPNPEYREYWNATVHFDIEDPDGYASDLYGNSGASGSGGSSGGGGGSSSGTCSGQDLLINIYNQGSLQMTNSLFPEGSVVYEEYCLDENTLIERFCPEPQTLNMFTEEFNCPNGCLEGECIPDNPPTNPPTPGLPPPICGNGINEDGETCDDGNTINGDGCSSTCQTEGTSGGGGGSGGGSPSSGGSSSGSSDYVYNNFASMSIGEVINYGGSTITLDDVFSNDIQVNGELIGLGDSKKIGIYRIHVESIGYHSNTPELSKAIISYELI